MTLRTGLGLLVLIQVRQKQNSGRGVVFGVLRSLRRRPLLSQALYAVAVCSYFQWAVPAGAPAWAGDAWRNGAAPHLGILNLVSFALAMLLVFRVQTVGARWTEARAAWGFIFNGCRNVARLFTVWLSDPAQRDVARRWTVALPLIARHHLRRHTLARSRPDIMTALTAAEADWLLRTASHHTPTAAAGVLESLAAAAALAPVCELALSNELNVYINAIGSCERIRGTNPPLAITRLTSRFLQTWLALLPWTLWSACHWLTVLLHAVISTLLLGIDNIASQLEEPLERLPLVIYAGVLADDVRHIWAVADGAAAVASGNAPVVPEGEEEEMDDVVGAEPSVAPDRGGGRKAEAV